MPNQTVITADPQSLKKVDWSSITNQLLPKNKLDPCVAALDITRLRTKLRHFPEGDGWPAEVCIIAESEYRRFLTIKRFFYTFPAVPNLLMDQFWHAHILDTRNYHADCNALFGEYFHHYPFFGARGDKDRAELGKTYQVTKTIYAHLFGQPMDAAPAKAAGFFVQNKRGHLKLPAKSSFAVD